MIHKVSTMIKNDKKIRIGYTCSFVPTELYIMYEIEWIPFFEIEEDNKESVGNLPIALCDYIRYCEKILGNIQLDGIVLTNCCNASQRLYDIVRLNRPEIFCHIIDLPRGESLIESKYFESTIGQLYSALKSYFKIHRNLQPRFDNVVNDKSSLESNTIYVLGSELSSGLQKKIRSSLNQYSIVFNVCSNRSEQLDPVNFYHQNPCARMDNFLNWFNLFITKEHVNLVGLIYFSTQHCDNHLFNYTSIRDICQKYGVPVLGLEERFCLTGFGQLSTRLDAFSEGIQCNKNRNKLTKKVMHTHSQKSGLFKQSMRLVHGIIKHQPLDAIKMVVENQINIFSRLAWDEPEKIIWTNMVMPCEIFYAAGLIPINMELVSGWLASLGLSKHYISIAEGLGFSSNICSYHKATIGLLHDEGLPLPKAAVFSSHICDGGPMVANYLKMNYGTNVFNLNVPFSRNEINHNYLTDQYSQLLNWINEYTGRKIDENDLKKALELTNSARDYWIKAFDLRKGEPLFNGHLSLRNLFGTTFLFGSTIGVDVAKAYYNQLVMVSKSRTIDINRKRILWIHFAPLYENKLMEYLENDLNCWIVMDITGHMYWEKYDLNEPLASLAKRTLAHFYLGEPEQRNELYSRLVNEYRIDGIIHFMHVGCRAIPGYSSQIRKIAKEQRIPYLELEGNCIDPRGSSQQQLRMRLEAFSETLRGV